MAHFPFCLSNTCLCCEPVHPRLGKDSGSEDEELAAQLSSIKYKINTAGQIQIESKDDMRTRLGRSPDEADAAMLTEAEEGQCVVFPTESMSLQTSASKWSK